jgi:type II secretory pathway component GspD/PulD (secretin)
MRSRAFFLTSLSALALVSLSLVAAPGRAFAQEPAKQDAPKPEVKQETPAPPITGKADNADLRTSLRYVFELANKDFTIEPGVQGTASFKFTNMPLDEALKLLLRSTGAKFHVEKGVYIVEVDRAETTGARFGAPFHGDAPPTMDPSTVPATATGQATTAIKVAEVPSAVAAAPPAVTPAPVAETPKLPGIPADPIGLLNDGKELWVVRGTTLYRIRKLDLKVLAKTQLK